MSERRSEPREIAAASEKPSRGHVSAHDEADEDPRPVKKPRKQRPCYSCDECRRLKMKCNRQVPCSNCVRRQREQFCNGQPSANAASTSSSRQRSLSQTTVTNRPLAAAKESAPSAQNIAGDIQRGRHQDVESQPQQQVPHSNAAGCAQDLPHDLATLQSHHHIDGIDQLNMHTGDSTASSNVISEGHEKGSHGTLLMTRGGRFKYLGPTSASEWLKDSETQDQLETAPASRLPSPEHLPELTSESRPSAAFRSTNTFPFSTCTARISTRYLLSELPAEDEARSLVESYYRYCAWHHNVAPRASFEKTFERVYKAAEVGQSNTRSAVHPQEIALVFIVLAQGTVFNIELPSYDDSVEEWLYLSQQSLVKGNFMSDNMIVGLQTLHLMAHLYLHLDQGRRGDNAWPLWGLVMRLVQAMGMHRDGARWNLPDHVVEERRKVFWECNSADIFQAHCFSRPSALNPDHCDTLFPIDIGGQGGEKSYSILRFELSQISSEILNMAMKVQQPDYTQVMELDSKLGNFEGSLPFYIRCRAALLSMPSRYPQFQEAIDASPEPSRRAITISFQQSNLALNICETIINLHRTYFAKALYDTKDDMIGSPYMPSFLTVIERCAIIIALVSDIHARFPAVSIRQWNLWFHVFNSALCLGTIILRDPQNTMSAFSLAQIDAAVGLFTSLTQHGATNPRYHRNLQWLTKLWLRASSKMSMAASSSAQRADDPGAADAVGRSGSEGREDEDLELLGWRTRLVERADRNRQTIKTIHPSPSSNTAHHKTAESLSYIDGKQHGMTPNSTTLPTWTPDSTNDLLHDFWDPLLLQGIFDANDPFSNNGSTWWEDATAIPGAAQGNL